MTEIKLSKDQQEVFENIKNNPKQNFFIQGQAGTGKSTLINYIKNNLGREYAIVAPTGIAAELIGGSTIHSLFKLGGRPYFPLNIVEKYKKYSDVVERIETLIIDEASMLRADIFDTVNMLCQKAKKNNKVFGGIQVILVGDLYQLPPVYKYENAKNDTQEQKKENLEAKQYIKENYHDETPFFFDARCYPDGNFKLMELTEHHRQKEADFLRNLMIISHNEQDKVEEALNYFNSSVSDTDSDKKVPIVTSIRKDADYINQKELNEIVDEEIRKYEAKTSGDYYDLDKIKEENRKGTPLEILEYRKNSIQVPTVLELKKGAKVMICKNAQDNSYVNGTIGSVENFLDNEEKIVVKLEDGSLVELEKATWKEQEYVVDENNPEKLKLETIGTFEQFPLKLAYAITIHKSQGQTWDNVCIDLGEKGAFSAGQVYVALSRVKTRAGIHLKRRIDLSDIKVNKRVDSFIASGGMVPDIENSANDTEFECKLRNIQKLKKRVSKISRYNTSSWTIYNNELAEDLYLQAGKEENNDKKIYIFKIKGGTYTENNFEINDQSRFGKKGAKPDPRKRDISIDLRTLKEVFKKNNPVNFSNHLWKIIDYEIRDVIDSADYIE